MADLIEKPRPLKRNRKNPDGTPRMGRPTLLTLELQEDIARLVEAGNYPVVAAQYYGVSAETFYGWMARGENPEHPRNVASADDTSIYVTFARRIREAETKPEVRAVLTIIQEAREDSGVALRFLERRYKQRWRVDTLQVSGPDGGPVRVESIGAILDDHEKQVLRDVILAELARREAEAKEPVEA